MNCTSDLGCDFKHSEKSNMSRTATCCGVFNAGRGQSVQGADRARVRLFDWAGEKRQTIWQAQGCATDPFSYRASAFFRFHENIKIPDTSVTSPVRVNTQL